MVGDKGMKRVSISRWSRGKGMEQGMERQVTNHPFLRVCLLATLAAVFLWMGGCASPVGVRYLEPHEAYRKMTENVLSGSALSAPTVQILHRSGLEEVFRREPGRAIASLHKGLPTVQEADRLFALSELSFLHGSTSGDRQHLLSSALYAYAFLFPGDRGSEPDPFDPRFRTAVELYNQGIVGGFQSRSGGEVVLKEGTYPIPWGDLVLTISPDEFRWGSFRLNNFRSAMELEVRGLRNWYRWPGIGAPLVASIERLPGVEDPAFAKVPPAIKVAATALFRPDNIEEGLRSGRVTGRLELMTKEETTTVDVYGRTIPVEFGLSSALAYTLEGSQVYRFELKGFFSGNFLPFKETSRFKDNVFLMAPFRPGRIPLVLVHGTASSPARWAQLINEIQNDRELWGKYQIWLFTYNTGNPVLYSAGIMANGLRKTVQELDPEGKDSAIRKMVIVGHSQGGLLAKLTAVYSGGRFWDDVMPVPLDDLDVTPETAGILRRSLVYEPLPFVKRVVFISTPHGGSYVAGGFVGWLAGKFISLPARLLHPFSEVFASNPDMAARFSLKDIPRSTDNMDPKSPFIRALSSIPMAPGIIAHSIIAVKNPDDPKEKWNDGVVEYGSAHIDGVASELIVHSGHSTQDEPQTIEEVRRILIENLREP